MSDKTRIVLSLISHTNIGKTTLARTLLRRDVGEVKDEAHVTDESTSYTMLETQEASLVLWDTPGFGNIMPLLKRLKSQGGAWGWVLHEVVDRVFNRSLYSSLEAAKNIIEEAHVVLYLVNVREQPEDAGYVAQEFKLLEALDKPVVMILNQLDQAVLADPDARRHIQERWHQQFESFSCLKAVMILDAFTRTWHQELGLIQTITPLVSPTIRQALENIAKSYKKQQAKIFHDCAHQAALLLWHAKTQSLDPSQHRQPKELFQKLVTDLQNKLDLYLDLIAEAHEIEAEGRARFEADLKQVTGQTATKLDEKKSGLLAGAISSAGTGLVADVFSGGLTFGGGAILGFLGGFFGGLSYAKMMNIRKRGNMTWRNDTLLELFQLLIVYYLVASHHGKGKGALNLDAPLEFIGSHTAAVWQSKSPRLEKILDNFINLQPGQPPETTFLVKVETIFETTVDEILAKLYPSIRESAY